MTAHILTDIPTIDRVLGAYVTQLGPDFTGYRNHTYRLANLCVALAPGGREQVEKIAVASAFHDLGIWSNGTFDYLEPSSRLARAYLIAADQPEWSAEIERMIADHHKLTPSRAGDLSLVEAFRKADWIDVSRGALKFGLPATLVRSILSTWPSAGFHKRLIQLALKRLRTHPLTPLPMMRL